MSPHLTPDALQLTGSLSATRRISEAEIYARRAGNQMTETALAFLHGLETKISGDSGMDAENLIKTTIIAIGLLDVFCGPSGACIRYSLILQGFNDQSGNGV